MEFPVELKYTRSHEWVRAEIDGTLTVGITEHGQDLLGDLVFVGQPECGKAFAAEEAVCVLESVKAAVDVHMPVAGTVLEFNLPLAEMPETINRDAYGAWIFRLMPENAHDLEKLLDAVAYQGLLEASS